MQNVQASQPKQTKQTKEAKQKSRIMKELYVKVALTGIAWVALLSLCGIFLFLVLNSLPLFKEYSVIDFLFGMYWYPTHEPPDFGIFPLIIASIAVTVLSCLIAVPLGVFTAAYLAEIAHSKTRRIIKPFIELLASLPSVVIGFFGMVVVAPYLQEQFDLLTGLNLFNAALMLAFMSVPTICTISEDALHSVSGSLREASLALGATKWETLIRVIIPSALPGIGTAIMLGMSRAIGETMVVLMVAGGAALIPMSIFDPVRPMPASIAAEMAEAPYFSEHYLALFSIGLVLFVFTFCFNYIAFRITEKHKQVGSSGL